MGKWDHLARWESQVLAALSAGDIDRAIQALIEGYQHTVVGFCISRLGDATQGEEVAQEVFLAAWRTLHGYGFRQKSSVRNWLLAIAHNRCATYVSDMVRNRRRNQMVADHRDEVVNTTHPNPPVSPEVSLLDAEKNTREEKQHALVVQSLQRLSPDDRGLLMMQYYEELSIVDIARRLLMSESTTRRRLQTAESRLKETMAKLCRENCCDDA